MGLIINHNLMALNAANNLTATYSRLAGSVSRLSSGLRISSSADDAAGLAVREIMRSDIRVLNQGVRNAQDAINMLMTADGAMSVIDEKLIRMKELAEQASTGTYTDSQRAIMNDEFQAMADEIERIANATDFNGIKLLDGTMSTLNNNNGLKVHFGTGNDSDEDYYFVNLSAVTKAGLGLGDTEYSYLTGTGNFSSSSSALSASGFFGFFMDGSDAGTTASALTEIGNVVQVTSTMSLEDLRDQINLGVAARGTLTFSGGDVAEGATVTIGGVEFEFHESAAAINSTAIFVDLGAASAAAAAAITALLTEINNHTGLSFWAVETTATAASITILAKNAGAVGNDITLSGAAAGSASFYLTPGGAATAANISATSTNLALGGTSWATASIVTGTSATGETVYNLRLAAVAQTSTVGTSSVEVYRTLAGINFNASGSDGFDTHHWTAGGITGLGAASTDWAATSGSTAAVDITTQSNAQSALGVLDSAINTKDGARAVAGYTANRLENTVTNLTIQAEMLQSSEAAISDADIAMEMTEFTRNMILAQSGVAMLAQANSIANMALSLIGG